MKKKSPLSTQTKVKVTPVKLKEIPKFMSEKPSPPGGVVPKRQVKTEGVTPKSPPRAPPVQTEVFKAPLPVDSVVTTTSQPPAPEDMDTEDGDQRKEDEATGGTPIIEPQDSSSKGHFGDQDPVPETLRRSICAVVTDEEFDQINKMHLVTFGGLEALSELYPDWFLRDYNRGSLKRRACCRGSCAFRCANQPRYSRTMRAR